MERRLAAIMATDVVGYRCSTFAESQGHVGIESANKNVLNILCVPPRYPTIRNAVL